MTAEAAAVAVQSGQSVAVKRRRFVRVAAAIGWAAVTVVAAVLGYVVGAASERDSSSSNGRASPTTLTSPSSTATPTVEAGSQPLADGRHFGYITDADNDARLVTFDLAQWFSGDAANNAAAEDGVIESGEGVPNDYYVRNINRSTRLLGVASSARIVIARVDCTPTCDPVGAFEGLADSFHDDTSHDLYSPYRGADTQYWLTVRDGVVVEIEEQYVP